MHMLGLSSGFSWACFATDQNIWRNDLHMNPRGPSAAEQQVVSSILSGSLQRNNSFQELVAHSRRLAQSSYSSDLPYNPSISYKLKFTLYFFRRRSCYKVTDHVFYSFSSRNIKNIYFTLDYNKQT